jgi:hypothetical protein
MEKTKNEIEIEEYLESIGGLESGYRADAPPIKDSGFFCVGDGWLPLIKQLISDCVGAGWDKQICQVKEKFGGLRFYINSAPEEVHGFIRAAESKSYEICEKCGEPGELRTDISWYSTLCENHYEELKRKRDGNKGN